jgi:hypothetical protein
MGYRLRRVWQKPSAPALCYNTPGRSSEAAIRSWRAARVRKAEDTGGNDLLPGLRRPASPCYAVPTR